jgi:hypothetical protein
VGDPAEVQRAWLAEDGVAMMDIKDVYEHADEDHWSRDADWVPVASLDGGGGYDWAEMHVFWSPSARQFFYASASGCSCSAFHQNVASSSSWSHTTDRRVIIDAMTLFADENPGRIKTSSTIDAAGKVSSFLTRTKASA